MPVERTCRGTDTAHISSPARCPNCMRRVCCCGNPTSKSDQATHARLSTQHSHNFPRFAASFLPSRSRQSNRVHILRGFHLHNPFLIYHRMTTKAKGVEKVRAQILASGDILQNWSISNCTIGMSTRLSIICTWMPGFLSPQATRSPLASPGSKLLPATPTMNPSLFHGDTEFRWCLWQNSCGRV